VPERVCWTIGAPTVAGYKILDSSLPGRAN
jgi:hypothetical protein